MRRCMLTLNTSPTLTGARKVTYRPVASESNLIYLDWVDAEPPARG